MFSWRNKKDTSTFWLKKKMPHFELIDLHEFSTENDKSHNIRKRTFSYVRQRRLKSTCTSTQSGQSLRCLHEGILHPSLFKMCPVKILSRQADLNLRCAHISKGTFSEGESHVLQLCINKVGNTRSRSTCASESPCARCSLLRSAKLTYTTEVATLLPEQPTLGITRACVGACVPVCVVSRLISRQ